MKTLIMGLLLAVTGMGESAISILPSRLAKVPDTPFLPVEGTVYIQNFSSGAEGASGEYRITEGRWGQGLQMDLPDGRFDVDATGFDLGATGTIEWWAKPRPVIQGWWDQAWRYFLHVQPVDQNGFQLDLSRHPIFQLRLSATKGMEPFQPIDYPEEKIQINTSNLDIEVWQHLLVSWDLTGSEQRIWLFINGEGYEMSVPAGTFTPGRFRSIEFGNRPSKWRTPYIPMDGSIDEIHINNRSVERRLIQ